MQICHCIRRESESGAAVRLKASFRENYKCKRGMKADLNQKERGFNAGKALDSHKCICIQF